MNKNCDLTMINGNSIDVVPQGCDSEIKADIVVTEFNSVRLWGQIVNCHGQPVSSALLKLIKIITDCNGKCIYQGIAHTVSDCNGFYQFDLCVDDPCAKYKVLVNKSATGTERIIETGTGNCNACVDPGYTPCGEYKYRVTPPDKFDCVKVPVCNCEKCSSTNVKPSYEDSSCIKEACNDYCLTQNKYSSSCTNGNVYPSTKIRF